MDLCGNMYVGQNVLLYAFRYQFPFKTTLVKQHDTRKERNS